MAEITVSEVWGQLALHRTNVGSIVRDASSKLLGVDARGRCIATPERMRRLVDGLSEYTDEVVAKIWTSGVFDPLAIMDDDQLWPSPSQWNLDLSRWLERLTAYKDALDDATKTGQAGCNEIFDAVTQPLLVGWYQPGTPGIINTNVQTVPDIATPFLLGNQLIEFRDWELERLRLLVKDIVANAKKLVRKVKDRFKFGAILVGGGLAIAGGVFLGTRLADD